MKKGKDNNQENLPPSLFDNLDLFALAGAGSAPDGAAADGGAAAAEAKPAKTKAAKTPPAPPKSEG